MQFSQWCKLPKDAENVTVNNQSGQVAWTGRNNLFIHPLLDGHVQAVTNDPDINIS